MKLNKNKTGLLQNWHYQKYFRTYGSKYRIWTLNWQVLARNLTMTRFSIEVTILVWLIQFCLQRWLYVGLVQILYSKHTSTAGYFTTANQSNTITYLSADEGLISDVLFLRELSV